MSESLLLSQDERERFIRWLDRNADSNKAMIEQWQTMNGPHIDAITKKLRTEEVAYRIVASILRNTEEMSVGD